MQMDINSASHSGSAEEECEKSSTEEKIEPKQIQTNDQKKKKRGIVYISSIPKNMNVAMVREIFGNYGKIGRIYLQPATKKKDDKKKKRKKRLARHFTEGWVEFERKKDAKFVTENLNNTQISTRKKSQFYDVLWNIKYLSRFKWIHLSERITYEKAIYKQRLQNEISQARKEAAFFQDNVDKSNKISKFKKKKHNT